MPKLLQIIVAVLALGMPFAVAIPAVCSAQEQGPAAIMAGDLTISAYRAKAMLPGQPVGSGFLTIANKGVADRLLAVSSPSAGMVEIHTMEIVDNVMTMRPVEGGLEIPAGATVELRPGGMHLMFMHVAEPFEEGAAIPVTLQFEKAGKVELTLPVVGPGG